MAPLGLAIELTHYNLKLAENNELTQGHLESGRLLSYKIGLEWQSLTVNLCKAWRVGLKVLEMSMCEDQATLQQKRRSPLW